ncbi:unnamed protein product [Alopecurus aequalis]
MAAAAGAVPGGVNPKQKPNPSASRPGGLRSPKNPAALADITNTGRPNPPRSITVADLLKENAKLGQLLAQKTKIIELSSVEINKLRFVLHATHQQNLNLAQANSQITAELNQGKERLKLLQHELACATAVIKLKGSGLERKSTTADNQLQKEVASQEEQNAAPSKLAPVEAHQADASVPCNTVLEEGLTAKTNKRTSVSRRTSKRKSESCEGTKDTTAVQPSYKPAMQPPGSSHHEDQRNTLRRRSSRLNPGSCEMSEVSCETLHMDTDVPSSSSFSVRELETNSGKDMKARQGNTAGHKVETEELSEKEMNKQPEQEVNVEEEIQEADPSAAAVGGLEAHQTDDNSKDTNPNHLPETQSSPPYNIIKHPEPPQKRATKRVATKRKLESREGQKDSNIEEDATTKLHSTSSEPLHHEETRKSRRRISSRVFPESCEVTEATLEEAGPEDTIAPLPPSSSKILIEQSATEKQNDRRPSTEPSEEQATGRRSSVEVTGRRSSVRGAAKAVSYKEIPLNVKMRRP